MRCLAKVLLLASSVALLLVSCDAVSKSSDQQVALQNIKADLEDLKHQMHNVSMDISIIEEKVNNQDLEFASFQDRLAAGNQAQQRVMKGSLVDVESKLDSLDKFQVGTLQDIRNLKENFNSLNSSLSQYKDKLNVAEKNVSSLKTALESIMAVVQRDINISGNSITYKVQAGDSLDRISRRYNTTVEAIKKINDLDSDLIVIGQELRLPN